jgi:phage/plasmid-like protein (TIGR03299 family)
MAHEISINEKTGQASVFTVREPAWHGLGITVPEAVTAEEAIKLAGLDFEVKKRKLFTRFDKKMVEVESAKVITREDTGQTLGVVGNGYTPIQNKECFSFFDNLVSEKEAIYHTAGALGSGERVWILAKLPTNMVIGKDDLIENYVLIYNSHDGSSAITALMTPTRVVCNNTLGVALRNAQNKVSIRHTKNAEDRLRQAHEILGLSSVYRTELKSAFDIMAKTNVSQAIVDSFLSNMFDERIEGELVERSVRTKEKIKDIFESSVGGLDMKVCRGTMYGLFNAVTFFNDNVVNYRDLDTRMYGVM